MEKALSVEERAMTPIFVSSWDGDVLYGVGEERERKSITNRFMRRVPSNEVKTERIKYESKGSRGK